MPRNKNKQSGKGPAQSGPSAKPKRRQKRGDGRFAPAQDSVTRAARNVPVASSRPMQTVSRIRALGNEGNMLLHRREYVADLIVAATSDFQNNMQIFNINPMYTGVFPWTSKLAVNFESYRFRMLKVHLKAQQAATTAGYMVVVADFDAVDAPPATKQDIMQYQGVRVAKTWEDVTYDLTPQINRLGITRYMGVAGQTGVSAYPGTAPTYGTRDPNSVDSGRIIISADNLTGPGGAVPAGAVIAEIWYEYELEFITPQ